MEQTTTLTNEQIELLQKIAHPTSVYKERVEALFPEAFVPQPVKLPPFSVSFDNGTAGNFMVLSRDQKKILLTYTHEWEIVKAESGHQFLQAFKRTQQP